MQETSIYGLQGPSAWPEPPGRFSFSSLATIDICPLQWQLVHGRYGNLQRFPARPHPAAVEGDIVHKTLDILFKSLALAGLPAFGTGEFRKEVAGVDVRATVDRLVAEHEARLVTHPRGAGFRLRVGQQQLVNQVIRLFRSEYAKATATPSTPSEGRPSMAPKTLSGPQLLDLVRARGALSELHLEHPSFPFVGIIDLVRTAGDGIVVLDFKTGEPKQTHEAQVLVYGILWWRKTGQPPVRVEVRYPSGAKALEVDEQALEHGERELGRRIEALGAALSQPLASARLGDHCRYCDVRQFCDAYWKKGPDSTALKKAKKRESIDIEITVDGPPSSNGFAAKSRNGAACNVVHASDGPKVHGPFAAGEVLRILNARAATTDDALELMPWTEVFHRHE